MTTSCRGFSGGDKSFPLSLYVAHRLLECCWHRRRAGPEVRVLGSHIARRTDVTLDKSFVFVSALHLQDGFLVPLNEDGMSWEAYKRFQDKDDFRTQRSGLILEIR